MISRRGSVSDNDMDIIGSTQLGDDCLGHFISHEEIKTYVIVSLLKRVAVYFFK